MVRIEGEIVIGRPVEVVFDYAADPVNEPQYNPHMVRAMPQADFTYALRFQPTVGGTRMRWSGQVHPKGAFKLLGPLIAWMGTRQEERIWTSMKRHLEANAAPS